MSDEELHRLLLRRMDSQAEDIEEIRRQTAQIPVIVREVAEAKEHAREAKEQGFKTNGRVGKLETWRAYLEGRQSVTGEHHDRRHSLKVSLAGAIACGLIGGALTLIATLAGHL